MKKIVIYTQDGVRPDLKLVAKEGVEEFLSVFPEYKNSFKIEFRDDTNIQGKEISQAEFDALPDSPEKQSFIKSPRGTWLVPYKSMEWYIASSRAEDGSSNIDAKKLITLHTTCVVNNAETDVPICLVNNNLTPSCYGYTSGVTKTQNGTTSAADAIVVSMNACSSNKEFLKTVLIHELGHVFRATDNNRANTEENFGPHCTNDLCVMRQGDLQQQNNDRLQRKALHKPPFCNDCIESMREYLSHIPGITKEIIIDEFEESLEPLPHNNREWKKQFRDFYRNVATRDGDEYKEDLTKVNYVAHIKRSDGSRLEIEANNDYHVALGVVDKDGNDDIPSLKDMRDFVELAKSKNSNVSFNKDNEPEFNARLMIACLEFKPQPMTMSHKPEVNKEFLDQLEPQTRQHLQHLLNPQQQTRTLVIGNANSGASM